MKMQRVQRLMPKSIICKLLLIELELFSDVLMWRTGALYLKRKKNSVATAT